MNTPLRLSPEPVDPAIEAAAAHAEDISNAFRDLQIVLPPDTLVRRDEPLARRTTLRVGGPADLFIEPSSDNALASTLEIAHLRGIPVFLLGRGSNLLVRDGGIRGIVLSLSHPTSRASNFKVNGSPPAPGHDSRASPTKPDVPGSVAWSFSRASPAVWAAPCG